MKRGNPIMKMHERKETASKEKGEEASWKSMKKMKKGKSKASC